MRIQNAIMHAVVGSLLFNAAPAHGEYPYQVIDLGKNLSPWAINDLGDVVGGGFSGNGQAFRWNLSSGIEYLGTLGGQNSWAYDISNSGVIVGGSQITNQPERAFKWTSTEGMQQLQLLGNQSTAFAINESNEIAGLNVQNGNMRACYWNPTGVAYSAGGVGTSQQQSFRGINEAGVAAGFGMADTDGHHHAFTWTASSGINDLGVLAGADTHVKGISDSGMIVGYSNPGAIGYAWSPATGLHTLQPLNGQFSVAEGVNGNELVVGEYGGGADLWHAFLWNSSNGMVDISPPGWTDTRAYDINQLGWIVGEGIAPNGQQHGFALIPEPVSLAAISLGWIAMQRRGRQN